MKNHNYYIYFTTNPGKTVFYIGVTNDLGVRKPETFAGKYYCFKLIYWERFSNITHAIEREKGLKGWSRKKKEELIKPMNPNWNTLEAN